MAEETIWSLAQERGDVAVAIEKLLLRKNLVGDWSPKQRDE
jgi:hypothetical protein